MSDSFADAATIGPRVPVSRVSANVAARRLRVTALLYAVALSLLFVLVYGGSNAVAAHRAVTATCFFAWELRIPFVSILVVPYLTIDLLFFASFFLCEDRVELRAHGRRIIAAILAAGMAFLAFPLTTGYPRPAVNGWDGRLFAFLWSFDKPHNLVPSLHVALALILWPRFGRRTHWLLRGLAHIWFSLIVASALLTWQHHVLDVVTGTMLSQTCLVIFPGRRDRACDRSRKPNWRVAGIYAGGPIILAISAVALGSWWWALLWPALSLALVATAYARGSSSVFGKAGGRLPLCTRVVLGPYLMGVAVRVWVIRMRGGRPWTVAAPAIYQGRLLTGREATALRELGITGVLDLTAEHAETVELLEIDYLNVPVLDLTAPSHEQLERAVEFIAKHARCGAGVYIHCALGISRSAAAVTAFSESCQTRITAGRVGSWYE